MKAAALKEARRLRKNETERNAVVRRRTLLGTDAYTSNRSAQHAVSEAKRRKLQLTPIALPDVDTGNQLPAVDQAIVDSLMNEHEQQNLRRRAEQELETIRERMIAESIMTTTVKAHAEAIADIKAAAKADQNKAAEHTERSVAARDANNQANQSVAMSLLQSFLDSASGDQMIDRLTKIQQHQSITACFGFAELTSHKMIEWHDRFHKIQHSMAVLQARMLSKETIEVFSLHHNADIDVVVELSSWLSLVRHSECSWLTRLIIARFLHHSLLAPFVDQVEKLMLAHMKKKGKVYDTKTHIALIANDAPTIFAHHRNIIHIVAIHCHLRLLLWHLLSYNIEYKQQLINLTTFLYSLLYTRDIEFSLERPIVGPLRSDWRELLNNEQLRLGRNWCIFILAFPLSASEKNMDPSVDLVKTLMSRYQYDKTTIIDRLTTHLKRAISQPPFAKICLQLRIPFESKVFSEKPAEWCLKVLSNDQMLSLLNVIVKGAKRTIDVDSLYGKIVQARRLLEESETLSPFFRE